MLARSGKMLVVEHLVEMGSERGNRCPESLHLLVCVLGHEPLDDDARLVQHDVAQRNALGDGFAVDHRGHRFRQLDRCAGASNRARDDMLGNHHRRGLEHFDILVGVLLWRAVLHHQYAEHLPAALNRNSEQRVIDILASLRPV